MRIARGFLMVIAVVSTISAQYAVNLSGVVSNKSGLALKDAIVTLESREVTDVTNISGQYSIQVLPAVNPLIAPVTSSFIIRKDVISFSIKEKMPVKIDIFDLKGRIIGVAVDKILPAGDHSYRFPMAGVTGNIYVIRTRMGSLVSLWKYMSFDNSVREMVSQKGTATTLAKMFASIDTIRASKAGYKSARVAISALTGVIDITLDSLENDSTGSDPFTDGSADRLKQYGEAQYFWGDLGGAGVQEPIVKITNAVSPDAVDLEVLFNPAFVDNTYGPEGQVGWNRPKPHSFKDLWSSDHVEIAITNGDGDTVFYGRLDLLSPTTLVSSGYAALGPFGGDGAIYVGDPSMIISYGTTLDDNWNYYGYQDSINSPTTDSTFKTNPDYPYYQYYVGYRLTLDPAAFGPSGYGEVHMTSVHASPSKNGISTVDVTEMPAPETGTTEDPFRFYTPVTTTPPDTSDTPDTTVTDTSDTPDTTVTDTSDTPDTTVTDTSETDTSTTPIDSVPPDTSGGVD